MFDKLVAFLAEFFRGDNGQSSFARITGFIVVMWKLVEGSYLAYVGALKVSTVSAGGYVITIPDLPYTWAGLVFALYGITKLATKGASNVGSETSSTGS